MNLNDYPLTGGVDIYVDTGGAKNLLYATIGKKIDGQTNKHRTSFGKYTIHYYKMGHSVLSFKKNTDYKVTIKDPEGEKHTLWARNGYKLQGIINGYLNHLIMDKVSREIKRMEADLKIALNNPEANQQIQQRYQLFQQMYGSYLPNEVLSRFQLAVGKIDGLKNAQNYVNESIDGVVNGLCNLKATQPVVGAAMATQQSAMAGILAQKLLGAKSEAQLLKAMQELKGVNRARSIDVPFDTISDHCPVTDKRAFHEEHHKGRREIKDRFVASYELIVKDYHALKQAVRDGVNVAAARAKLKETYDRETSRPYIRFKDKSGPAGYFKFNHAEILAAVNGESSWLIEYDRTAAAPAAPLFGEKEERALSIQINFTALLDADKTLGPADSKSGQEAFKARYEAAKNLAGRGVKAEDFESKDVDLSYISDIVKHYEWCEGSKEISDATKGIGEMLKKYTEKENGEDVVRFNALKNEELAALLDQAGKITSRAPKGSKVYAYGMDIAAAHYEILGDSYGKFAAHFAIGALRTVSAQTESRIALRGAQGLELIDRVFPRALQDGLLLPVAAYQGFSEAGLLNLRHGFSQRLNDDAFRLGIGLVRLPYEARMGHFRESLSAAAENARNLVNWTAGNRIEAAQMANSLVNFVLTSIYDPGTEANHRLYQNYGGITSALGWARSVSQATALRDAALSGFMAPFHTYEFLTSAPPVFKDPANATYLDLAKRKVHAATASIMPTWLQQGQMPENPYYFWLRAVVQNLQSAGTLLVTKRLVSRAHGSSRDVLAASVAVVAKTFFDGLMGSYRREQMEAISHNAQVNLKQKDYALALASFEKLKSMVPYDKLAFQKDGYASMRIFIASGYYESLVFTAMERFKDKVEDDKLLSRLALAVTEKRLDCELSELHAIGDSPDLKEEVRKNATQAADQLKVSDEHLYELFIQLQVARIIKPFPEVNSIWMNRIPCLLGTVSTEQDVEQIKEKLDQLVAAEGFAFDINTKTAM